MTIPWWQMLLSTVGIVAALLLAAPFVYWVFNKYWTWIFTKLGLIDKERKP